MSIRSLARRAFVATPLPEWRARRRATRCITVLGYHRVTPALGADYPFSDRIVSSTPEQFRRELRHVRDHFDVISMRELMVGLRNPALLPPRPAVLTFDDGYVDNFTYAFPLLRDAGLPATFFVCSGFVGTRDLPWFERWVCCFKRSRAARIESPFGGDDAPYELDAASWDRSYDRFRGRLGLLPWSQMDECLRRLEAVTSVDPVDLLDQPLFMSWANLRLMAASGMDVGGHTRRHPILANVDDECTLQSEVSGCYTDIAREMGVPPISFAYPWGSLAAMSRAADAAIEVAGFQITFSFINGMVPRRVNRLTRLARVHASCLNDFQAFRLRLAMAPLVA